MSSPSVNSSTSEISPLLPKGHKRHNKGSVKETKTRNQQTDDTYHSTSSSSLSSSPSLSTCTATSTTIKQDEPSLQNESPLRRMFLLSTLYLIAMMSSLDLTILAAIYSLIGSEFEQQETMPVVITAFFIASTILQPIAGRLSDFVGRKKTISIALGFFTIGNLGCGFAQNVWMMIAARIVAGIGAGGMTCMTNTIVSDVVSRRSRGKFQGIMNVFWGIGGALGGPLGGILADSPLGWRSAFYWQVPVGILCIILVNVFISLPVIIPTTLDDTGRPLTLLAKIDFLGIAILIVGFSSFITVTTLGGVQLSIFDIRILALIALTIFSVYLFIQVESKVARFPLITPQAIRKRSVRGALMTIVGLSMANQSLQYSLPLYYLIVRKFSQSKTGYLLSPYLFAISSGSLASGLLIERSGSFRWILNIFTLAGILGTISMIISLFYTSHVSFTIINLFISGLIFGALITPILVAAISESSSEELATTTGLYNFVRSTAVSLGVTISQNLIFVYLRKSLPQALSGIDNQKEVVDSLIHAFDRIVLLEEPFQSRARSAFATAIRLPFIMNVALSIFVFLFHFYIPDIELSHTS